MSNFDFFQVEWPTVFAAASKAAETAHRDPLAACFYARRGLDLAVAWAYKHDASLRLPYQVGQADGLFTSAQVDEMVTVLDRVTALAFVA